MNPWCASSRVSLATALPSAEKEGPVQRNGYASRRFQIAIWSPSASNAVIAAVLVALLRLSYRLSFVNHDASPLPFRADSHRVRAKA